MTKFEQRLRERGMPCRAETRDRLAILIPDGDCILRRRDVIEIARAEGFTHVAVELDPDVAALPLD